MSKKIDQEGCSNEANEGKVNDLSHLSAGNHLPASGPNAAIATKLYRRRWLMLFIFVLVFMTNAFQWIQFSIINNLIMKYYGVESYVVDWASLVFMVVYIPLIIPCAWVMDKMGLRFTVILGAIGSAAAAWINVMSVASDRFYVVLIGQTVASIAQVFVLGVSPNVAAVWFGPDEVSLACSIGVFGGQIGVALGFLIPPIMVKDHENVDEIGADLSVMLYVVAGFCTALLFSVVFGFQARPSLPPSGAQSFTSKQSDTSFGGYFKSVKRIMTNPGFVLLAVSYGINVGVFYAMSTLLNQTVLFHFPGEERNAGRIGLTIVVCGMIGSILFGAILDKTHKFKETTFVTYFFALVGMVAYTFTFQFGIIFTFVSAGITGFFMTGCIPVGFEFAAELTYPEPEVTSAGLLNASAQIFGIAFTLLGGWLLGNYDSMVCNGLLSAALLIGVAITVPIRSELRRQRANEEATFNGLGAAKDNPIPVDSA